MKRRIGLLLLTLLTTSRLLGQQNEEADIRVRDQAFGDAIAKADQRAFHNLVTTDVAIIRGDGITSGVETSKLRMPSLFGLAQQVTFSRSLNTLVVSKSRDLAVAIATHTLVGTVVGTVSEQHITVWRKRPEAEWRVAADGPIEVWRSLDTALFIQEVRPELFVSRLAPSESIQELESGPLWLSYAHDLAYSIGEFGAKPDPGSSPGQAVFGFYLATWENSGKGWHLLAASLPEPRGTSP